MIEYSREAERDVERHHDWLLAFSERAAAAFMQSLERVERSIDTRPRAFRALADGQTRRTSFRLRRTSYLVDYLIASDRIVILRVWHGRQNRPE